jgi:hypothetical protein
VLRLLFSAGVLALLLWILPWDQVTAAASRMTLPLYLGALAGFVAGHALGAIKWRLMLASSLGGARLTCATRPAATAPACSRTCSCRPSSAATSCARRSPRARSAARGRRARQCRRPADRLRRARPAHRRRRDRRRCRADGWAGPLAASAGIVVIGAGVLLLPLALRRPLARWPARVRRRGPQPRRAAPPRPAAAHSRCWRSLLSLVDAEPVHRDQRVARPRRRRGRAALGLVRRVAARQGGRHAARQPGRPRRARCRARGAARAVRRAGRVRARRITRVERRPHRRRTAGRVRSGCCSGPAGTRASHPGPRRPHTDTHSSEP